MNPIDYSEFDEQMMRLALQRAKLSLVCGEVPVGAVVVDEDGNVIGTGANMIEQKREQHAHAECNALRIAMQHKNEWRLDECTVYVTLEPCMMCLGLLLLCRVKRVVFGANSPIFGCANLLNYLPQGYKKDIILTGGLLADRSTQYLQSFFSMIRQQKRGTVMQERDSFVTRMKEQLQSRKEELLQHFSHDELGEKGSTVRDSADEAFSASMEKLLGSIQEASVEELNLVNRALIRINRGDYGMCVDCEEPISQKRLEYSPYAARCIVCQEALEQSV